MCPKFSRRLGFALTIITANVAFADSNDERCLDSRSARALEPMSLGDNLPATRTANTRAVHDEPFSLDETESDSSARTRLTEDDVTARQSVDTYNSLEDGQPGNPGSIELKLQTAWATESGEHDPIVWLTELQINPEGSDFWRNSQFTIGVPVELGLGDVDGNADVLLGWQQRWVTEDGEMPTLATLIEFRLPTGDDSSGVDVTLTGVIAKDLGPGTTYFNAFAKSANGNNIEDVRHFQWGFRAGYKWRISDEFSFIGDYVHQCSEEEGNANSNLLELSSEWHVNEHLTVGPGIVIGLDDNDETPNFGAGVRCMISF
ncbi:MAG: hypothetical protein H6819_12475 [Phycisphaerales bacterium]|nr:hypothetical protein [Phycisphaerales bacterium]MCB9855188.1 hypothetical protein [Phycisphaerales bacterium]MCB9862781.1 hypothetical protein [Phycisphaerales bacterium]